MSAHDRFLIVAAGTAVGSLLYSTFLARKKETLLGRFCRAAFVALFVATCDWLFMH